MAANESKPALDKLVDCDERQNVVTVPNVGKTRRQFHFDKVGHPASATLQHSHAVGRCHR